MNILKISLVLIFFLCFFSVFANNKNLLVNFSTLKWEQNTRFIKNPSAAAELVYLKTRTVFKVKEPGKTMMWEAPVDLSLSSKDGSLLLNYRGENIRKVEIFFTGGQHRDSWYPFKEIESSCDGNIHNLQVSLKDHSAKFKWADTVKIVVNSSSAGNASFELGELRLDQTEEQNIKAGESKIVKINNIKLMEAKPDWLGNPSLNSKAERTESGIILKVPESNAGMKWRYVLDTPFNIKKFKGLTIKYRTKNIQTAASDDYAFSVIGDDISGLCNATVFDPGELTADGQWHTLSISLENIHAYAYKKMTNVNAFAFQVIASSANACFEISEISFSDNFNFKHSKLEDQIPVDDRVDFTGYKAVEISADKFDLQAKDNLFFLNTENYFKSNKIMVAGIPFFLSNNKNNLVSTSIISTDDNIEIPINDYSVNIYVLLFANMIGYDCMSLGSNMLKQISDTDRFRVKINYADKTSTEQFPLNLSGKSYNLNKGVNVLALESDGRKKIQSIDFVDKSAQMALFLAGITIDKKIIEEKNTDINSVNIIPRTVNTSGDGAIFLKKNVLELDNSKFEICLDIAAGLRIIKFINKNNSQSLIQTMIKTDILKLLLDNKTVPLKMTEVQQKDKDKVYVEFKPESNDILLVVEVDISISPLWGFVMKAKVRNIGNKNYPSLALVQGELPFLIDSLENTWYCYPQRGIKISNELTSLNREYSTEYPLQFLSVFNPENNNSISILVHDRDGLQKNFSLLKDQEAVKISLIYPGRELRAKEVRDFPAVSIDLLQGDWHAAFESYQKYLAAWFTPACADKRWFRNVFLARLTTVNYMPPLLFNREDGTFDFNKIIKDTIDNFGCFDLVHLYDWGVYQNRLRTYARIGDTDPSVEWKNGWKGFLESLEVFNKANIRKSFYIEGYLYDTKGQIKGMENGQIITKNKTGLIPGPGTQIYMCPLWEKWFDIQTQTCEKIAKLTQADGVYLDSFGFVSEGKSCYSSLHGHEVPCSAIKAEGVLTKNVQKLLKKQNEDIVVLTEAIPVDVNTQYQDGSLSYALEYAKRRNSEAPIDLHRFAFPKFKSFEILNLWGSAGEWLAGFKWIFFNGKGFMITGSHTWYSPAARELIKKSCKIMHEYADLFNSDNPVPLVKSLSRQILINKFPHENSTIYTIYNKAYQSYDDLIMEFDFDENKKYFDIWNNREIVPIVKGAKIYIKYKIGPQDLGCLLVTDISVQNVKSQAVSSSHAAGGGLLSTE